MPQQITITPANPSETATLAQIWHDSWTYAHAHLIEPALREARTLDSFKCRIVEHLDQTLVARSDETPIGLSIIKDDELYQFFMSAEGRGTGAAAQLMQATEQKMAQMGITKAHLYCLIGNDRAMAFYGKMGWKCGELVPVKLEAAGQYFDVECWQVSKNLIELEGVSDPV